MLREEPARHRVPVVGAHKDEPAVANPATSYTRAAQRVIHNVEFRKPESFLEPRNRLVEIANDEIDVMNASWNGGHATLTWTGPPGTLPPSAKAPESRGRVVSRASD